MKRLLRLLLNEFKILVILQCASNSPARVFGDYRVVVLHCIKIFVSSEKLND